MKYVQTAVGDPGVGNGWFKIYEQGFNKTLRNGAPIGSCSPTASSLW